MAYSGKAEQRLAGSVNYKGSVATLNSGSVKGPSKMAKGDNRLVGKLVSSGADYSLYGKTGSADNSSTVAGRMSEAGYTQGPKWKVAVEPGILKPGKASQKNNTVRMTPGEGKKPAAMKVTSNTPKALRGGRVR